MNKAKVLELYKQQSLRHGIQGDDQSDTEDDGLHSSNDHRPFVVEANGTSPYSQDDTYYQGT